MPGIIDHLEFNVNTEDNCQWTNVLIRYDEALTADSLAKQIAYCLAKIRFGENSEHYRWWDESVRNVRTNNETEKKILNSYIRSSLGTRENPLTDNEIQAVVAETLWYEITMNTQTQQGLPIKVEEPHFTVTEPGGDGLAIYKNDDSEYLFRLWEVKKHNSDSAATSKITTASEQLETYGAEYLAKWSKVEQEVDHTHPGLSEFYAKMVDKWITALPDARAGISISKKHTSSITNTPIATARAKLFRMLEASQVEVMVISIPDFTNLAQNVRIQVWNGI